jgi:hypothetical protein
MTIVTPVNDPAAEKVAGSREELRGALVVKLRAARLACEQAQVRFAAPYSSHDAEVEFHTARGVHQGLGVAVEVFVTSS